MHFKGVFLLILLACVTIMKTGAQVDMMSIVKSILVDPKFVKLEEQEQVKILREMYAYLDSYYAYIRKKQKKMNSLKKIVFVNYGF